MGTQLSSHGDAATIPWGHGWVVPILIPLLVSAFRRAEDLGDAMDARCYSGAKGRTKYKKLTFTWRDLIGLLLFAALIAGVVLLNTYLGGKFEIIGYFVK